MSPVLRVEVMVPLHRFRLEAAFEAQDLTVGIFGNSGAGKTTLLEVIAGLRREAKGRIEFGREVWLDSSRGVERPPEARGVGYVPQDSLLFPHWDVERNVLAGWGRARRDGAAAINPEHVLDVLDLTALRRRRVENLSGGEGRRVALARALCSGPSLLLLDEPLASIESALRGRVLHYLLAVQGEFRIPTVYVSHEATEVTILCGEVVVLREGKVIARGRPADVFMSGPDRGGVAGADYDNVLEGTIADVEGPMARVSIAGGHTLMLAAAGGAPAGARVLVGVRAGDLMLAVSETPGLSARNVLPGTIRDLRDVDGGVLVFVSVSNDASDIAVVVTGAARRALALKAGMSVRLVVKAQSCRLLAVR